MKPTLLAVSVFSPCQAFKSFVQFRPPLCNYVPIHAITTCTPCNHLFPICHPRSLRYWIFIAWLFCIRIIPPCCNAFCVCRHLCSLALWFSNGAIPCRHWMCVCHSSVDMLRDKPSPLPFMSPRSSELHTASHTCDKLRRLSMRPTDLNNTFFLCPCFVDPHYTSCSITCSFPAILFPRYPHCNVFFFFLFSLPFPLPSGIHLPSIEDVCILAKH